MRTTIENKKSLKYDLSLDDVEIDAPKRRETELKRIVFYDFGSYKPATFVGFSNKRSCGFVQSLLAVDLFNKDY